MVFGNFQFLACAIIKRRVIDIYCQILSAPTGAIFEGANNEMTQWQVIYIYIKSRRKDKWEGNLRKKIVLPEERGRIDGHRSIGISEYGCYIQS